MIRFFCQFLTFIILFICQASWAIDCRIFEIYKDINVPRPHLEISSASPTNLDEVMTQISHLKGHQNFPKIVTRQKAKKASGFAHVLSKLQCLSQYLHLDLDKDGIMDWKIISDDQLLSHLLPNDDDWDNDGIENILDKNPIQTDRRVEMSGVPQHLWLDANSTDEKNHLQNEIFSSCGVLVLNHTGLHSVKTLKLFNKICSKILAPFKRRPYTFVLYAFAGHAVVDNVVASYYPSSNFMSVGGSRYTHKHNDSQILSALTHEIGHFLIFNLLSPKELYDVAKNLGKWDFPDVDVHSFYHPLLMQNRKGITLDTFVPTPYSRTNAHEWLSEVFSVILDQTVDTTLAEINQPPIPSELKKWVTDKLKIPLEQKVTQVD